LSAIVDDRVDEIRPALTGRPDSPSCYSPQCCVDAGELSMATTATAEQEQDQPATRFAKDHLKAFVERIEKLEEEKKAIADDIKDVYGEAKSMGFDVKALRTIIRMRKEDTDERKEHEAILETYMLALGMLN
jgi:uncharacterized protein (UPF0335 family)